MCVFLTTLFFGPRFGILLWWRSFGAGSHGPRPAIWAGLAFAGAALTKSQLALVLGPTLATTLVLDRLYYRQLGWRQTVGRQRPRRRRDRCGDRG